MRTPRISFNDERYLVLISSFSDGNEEMNLLLGINVVNEEVTVGLILPITMETDICLDGDGWENCLDSIYYCKNLLLDS